MLVRKFLGWSLPLALVVSLLSPAVAAQIAGPVDHALNYVAERQNEDGSFPSSFGSVHAATADAVLSFVAAGRGSKQVEAAMDWLEANLEGVDTLGKKAKVVMAAVAAGRDPRKMGPEERNLVQEIRATETAEGTFTSSPYSQVYDQALALLALEAADAAVHRDEVKWLADAQCPDGGWQFDQPWTQGEDSKCFDEERGGGDPALADYTASDTNTTGLVLQALAAVPRSVPLENDPFRWLANRRDPKKGGWGFDRSFRLTDSASTAIVLQAYAAYGRSGPKEARRALRALQRGCPGSGGFSQGWFEEDGEIKKRPGTDLGNTVAAILGLVREPLPVEPKPYLEKLQTPLCSVSSHS